MAFKSRSVSYELGVYRSLNARMDLSSDERQYYVNLEKGYQGEVMFDQCTNQLQNGFLVINDLCLEFNHSVFQIDTTIIAQEKIYPFEVKNFEGDFYYSKDGFHTKTNIEIDDPLEQLHRSKIKFQKLLRSNGIYLPLESYVVFINPEFTLYQAPIDSRIIFPTQVNRLIKKLDHTPSKLNSQHLKIAEKLTSMHQPKSSRTNLPPYKYEHMKKGNICSKCFSFMIYDGNRKLSCMKCGFEEHVESAILRSVEEIKLLFPGIQITTFLVHDWCKIIESKKMISRVLKQNYRMIGFGQWTYYE